MPPGLVGYVMEEKGEVVGKDPSVGSSNDDEPEQQELVEPPEALERDFVSAMGVGLEGVRAGVVSPTFSRAPSAGSLFWSHR